MAERIQEERKRDPHRCACGARFEVAYYGDPLDEPVSVDVACPRCRKAHSVPVPRRAAHDVIVELAPGLEAETGGGD